MWPARRCWCHDLRSSDSAGAAEVPIERLRASSRLKPLPVLVQWNRTPQLSHNRGIGDEVSVKQQRKRRHYTDEFKAEAVALVENQGYGVTEASRRLGLNRSQLDRWRQQAVRDPEAQVRKGGDDRDSELRQLRAEVRKLRMEREILKKATAFFANEPN